MPDFIVSFGGRLPTPKTSFEATEKVTQPKKLSWSPCVPKLLKLLLFTPAQERTPKEAVSLAGESLARKVINSWLHIVAVPKPFHSNPL